MSDFADRPDHGDQPLLRLVSGTPSDDELAALVVVLSSLGSSPVAAPEPAPSSWNRPNPPGTPYRPGPHSWRQSGLPALT